MTRRILALTAIGIGAFCLLIWAGFRIEPRVTEPIHATSSLRDRTSLYDGIPPALQFYLQQTVGRAPWVTETAVLWGTGRLRVDLGIATIWLPVVWREAIDIDRGYVWRGELTWWGWSYMDAVDFLDHDSGFFRFGDSVASDSCLNRGQAMRAQAERAWLPSSLIHSPTIEWRRRSRWDLVLQYSHPAGQDSLIARFDARTRALHSVTGSRCDSTQWELEFSRWDSPGGIMVPVEGRSLTDGEPYYQFHVEGIAYNVPVDQWFDENRLPSAQAE
jgi:hypothetical protein